MPGLLIKIHLIMQSERQLPPCLPIPLSAARILLAYRYRIFYYLLHIIEIRSAGHNVAGVDNNLLLLPTPSLLLALFNKKKQDLFN